MTGHDLLWPCRCPDVWRYHALNCPVLPGVVLDEEREAAKRRERTATHPTGDIPEHES